MQFNSYVYIFLFVPVVLLLYYISNRIHFAMGKIVLIVASVVFYSFYGFEMLSYIIISMGINYVSAFFIKRKQIKNRFIILLPIMINVGLLIYCKYSNFIIKSLFFVMGKEYSALEIILPVGISFYTFQQIAYLITVSRQELDNVNIIDYVSYILFFPKLLMGPLMEPTDFIDQINDSRRKSFNTESIACGVYIFSLGLIKKALFADTFAKAVSWVYKNYESVSSADCFLLVLFYTFEIYFDFSGYSDMAVGVASMLGIDLPINFDSPYKAISIRDFWKRWHISLTKFLTKYIYIPLGGSRKGSRRMYLNILFVFLISGIWHGANWTFVLWGLLHGAFCCFDRLLDKVEETVFLPMRWLGSFIVVSILWALFGSNSITQWINILCRAFCMQNMTISDGLINIFNMPESDFFYNIFGLNHLATYVRGFNMVIFVLLSCIICFIPENNYRHKNKIGMFSLALASISFVWGILCLGGESTFIYLGF